MDLKIAVMTEEEAQRLDLRMPNGEYCTYGKDGEKKLHLMLLSSSSPVGKKFERKLLDKRIKEQQRFRKPHMSAAQLEEDAIEKLAALTVGGIVCPYDKKKGKFLDTEIEINQSNAAELYRNNDWIKKQVVDFVEEDNNFLAN